jgi:DNA-binding beta-propeller fold protein YncE
MQLRLLATLALSLFAALAVLAPAASARTVTEINQGSFTVNAPTSVAVDPSGTFAYVTKDPGGGGPDVVQVIDMATKTIVAEITTTYSSTNYFDIGALAVSPNGDWLYVTMGQPTPYVLIIDLRAASGTYRQIVQRINAGSGIAPSLVFGASGTAFFTSSSGRRLYSLTGTPSSAALDMNLDTNTNPPSCIPGPGPIALGPSDATVYVPCVSGTRQNRILRVQPGASPTFDWFEFLNAGVGPYQMGINGLAFDPTRTTMYGTVSLHDQVAKFPNPGAYAAGSTQSNVTTVAVGDDPKVLGVDPTGNLLVVLNYTGGSVTVIKTATFAVDETLALGTLGTPIALAFNPTGTLALVASYVEDKVYVIDLDNAQPTPSPSPSPNTNSSSSSSTTSAAAGSGATVTKKATFVIAGQSTEGGTLAQRITVPGPGTVALLGTSSEVEDSGVCAGRRVVRKASTVWVQCALTTAARAALVHTSLRVRVKTTFTAKGGGKSSRTRVVRLAQSSSAVGPSAVTG